jgi:hypothetical protein
MLTNQLFKHRRPVMAVILAILPIMLILCLLSSSPVLNFLEFLILALFATTLLLERRIRTMWPSAVLVLALGVVIAIQEWDHSWVGSRRMIAIGVLVLFTMPCAFIAAAEGRRALGRHRHNGEFSNGQVARSSSLKNPHER